MSATRPPTRLALALLAATCLTPVGTGRAAPGDALGGPVSPKFQVNDFTTHNQTDPAVAMDASGDFVVAWASYEQDGDGSGVFAQRFDAAGATQGFAFQVNSFTTNHQSKPAVAMDANGDFVVAWRSTGQDGDSYGVFAQRFDVAGVAQGPEFQVNSYTAGKQMSAAVAMDAHGDFVVAWSSYGQDGDGTGVFARRYDAAGVAQGPEFQVNSFTTSSQGAPALAMDAKGDFAVAWASSAQDGSDFGVFAQRFDAVGVAQGPEFQVNSYTSSGQFEPAVGLDADGDFVVAWTSAGQDGDGWGVFAQRFDAAGVAEGREFQVNTVTAGTQIRPTVAMDASGDFIVAWMSTGIFARRYDAKGVPRGPQFQVGGDTPSSHWYPAAAMDADGDSVVAWASSGDADGHGAGIFAQRFDGVGRVVGDFDGDGNADLLWHNATTGTAVVWLMDGETRLAAGSIGAVPTVWEISGTGDFNGDGMADILWRNTGNGSTVVWQMNGLQKAAWSSIGAPPLTWVIEQIRDTNGDGLSDILWRNTGSGATVVWRMNGFTKVTVGGTGSVDSAWQVP
ncbi:MAG: VCBS repeat-containing protein [Rhodospirillales bacterium]|nr:VCBS repeat-containing protein [Rhodospirillales bacterium]